MSPLYEAARCRGATQVFADELRGFFQDQTGIVSAESKRIGDSDIDRGRQRFVSNVLQHGTFGVGVIQIDRRWRNLTIEGDQAGDRFDGGSGT